MEQQNEISNTEAKRIIHTREEEQRATAILEETTSNVIPGTLIMDIDEETEEETALAKAEQKPIIARPLLPVEPVIIVHELGDEEPEESIVAVSEEKKLIPTTALIKDENVI